MADSALSPMVPSVFGAKVGLSERTIRRMITNGDLEAFKINGRYKIPHSELVRLTRPVEPRSA